LSGFLYAFYTPILDININIVKSIKDAHSLNSTVTKVDNYGNVKAKSLQNFDTNTVNILMFMFNSREEAILKGYNKEADVENNNENNNGQQIPYRRIKFETVGSTIGIYNNTTKDSLPSAKEFSKVIYPYTYQVPIGNETFFSVALVILDIDEKKLLFLDPYMDSDSARRTLNVLKIKFEDHFSTNLSVDLYHTIIKEGKEYIDTDNYEKLKFTEGILEGVSVDDLSVIYMYVMIYHVIYSCPLIFKATDLIQFKDKICYMIMKNTLLL
jgi:hypothetical protein